MNGVQCDTCRLFRADPAGWFIVMRQQPSASPLAAILGGGGPELNGTFCTARCLAEWAYAKTVISETKSTGTGWPG